MMERDKSRAFRLLDRTAIEMCRQDEKYGWPRPVSFLADDEGYAMDGDVPPIGYGLGELMRNLEHRARILFRNGKPSWQAILAEEVGEVARENDPRSRVEELIQVAAVALSHAQALEEESIDDDEAS